MNLLKKKNATIIAVCCSLLLLGCSKHEIEMEPISYSYEVSENLKEMVDITVLYMGKDRNLISEKLEGNKWEKTILVARPFYAEMRIKCTPKGAFIPQKDYYNVYRKLSINESVSFTQNTLSSRNLFDYIDNLCSKTQTLFFDIK